jgi:hypothetical protein
VPFAHNKSVISTRPSLPHCGCWHLTFAISSPTIVAVTDRNNAPGRIIYLGACLIAAVRLAREERWDNSPRVVSRIADAIQLAKRIYERMQRDFGLDS